MSNLSRGFPWMYAFVMSGAVSPRASETAHDHMMAILSDSAVGLSARMSSSWPMRSKLLQATSLAFHLGVFLHSCQ